MANKVAIVTGASGNLGQAVVKKFISEGYSVVGTVIPNDPVQINVKDKNFETNTVNLMSEEDAEKFVGEVFQKNGSIDAAVLTVGGFAMADIRTTRIADLQKQYKLNFETAFNVARPVFTQMLKQQSGRIFLIGSKPGLDTRNAKGMVAYSLAKSLLFRLAELMNEEAKGQNVVTIVIVPSTIDTPENRKSMPDADPKKWVKPESIADVIFFYCTEEAGIIRESVVKVYNNA